MSIARSCDEDKQNEGSAQRKCECNHYEKYDGENCMDVEVKEVRRTVEIILI